MSQPTENITGPQRVAVVIPARNSRDTIAPTVRACRAIPTVDLIVVVDDGSEDETGQAARGAGAVVVRHSVPRGRGSALETGEKVVAMRDRPDWPARHLLILDPDLGDSAVEATALVEAVNEGQADVAIGVPTDGERGLLVDKSVERAATRAIRNFTGWTPTDPLATNRCATREAVEAATPFAGGWGVEVGSTIDLLAKGFTLVEIPCDFTRLSQPVSRRRRPRPKRKDVWLVVQKRRFGSNKLPKMSRPPASEQGLGVPYPVPAFEREADLEARVDGDPDADTI